MIIGGIAVAAPKVYSVTVKVPGLTGGTARVSCPSGTSLAFGGVEAAKTGLPYPDRTM